MKKYRLNIFYHGASFQGWQAQKNGKAVQDILNSALSTILRTPISSTGAARTDAGVHAENQIVTFKYAEKIDEKFFLRSLSGILPPEIGVKSLDIPPDHFHPIKSTLGKAYCYRLWFAPYSHPFLNSFMWTPRGRFNREVFKQELNHFVGKHDFSAFCASDSSVLNKVREIYEIEVRDQGEHLVEVWVSGDGFLKQMIRTIIGTALGLSSLRNTKSPRISIPGLLQKSLRSDAGATAPSQGLTLAKIYYDRIPSLNEIFIEREGRFFLL